MTDQCQHCTVRGDIEACLNTKCNQHESWFAKQIMVAPVSVEDRLPEDYCGKAQYPHESPRLLVWVDGSTEWHKGYLWNGTWLIDLHHGDFKVTHWLPMPPAPKED